MDGMKLVCYASSPDGVGKLVQGAVETAAPGSEIKVHRAIGSLAERLRRPGNGPAIVVLLAATTEELKEILSIRDLLLDLRIIVILPDRAKESISEVLSLRPRFITFVDRDPAELSAVLKKMVKTYQDQYPKL